MSNPEQPPQRGTEPAPGPQSNWSAGRVIGMVFASIGGLIGLALLVGGVAVLAAHAFARDDDGYYTSDREQLESATYAMTSEEIDLGADADDWAPEGLLGEVRIRVESASQSSLASGRMSTLPATWAGSRTTSSLTSTTVRRSSIFTKAGSHKPRQGNRISGSPRPKAVVSRP